MDGNPKQTLGARWEEFRPTKAQVAWACVACVALTLVVGFAWGGWVITGGTARTMAEDAARGAREQLAAAVCVDRFLAAADARAQLAALKGITGSYRQGKFVEEGGWATMPGSKRADNRVAGACAKQLAGLELPPVEEATAVTDGGGDAVVAQ